jgi:plastocyanin
MSIRTSVLSLAIVTLTAGLVYAAAPKLVSQKGKAFAPGTMQVKSGEELVFKNDDNVTHHIYSSTEGQEFNLRIMKPGQEGRHAFTKKGVVTVQCGLHPGMKLTVTVK